MNDSTGAGARFDIAVIGCDEEGGEAALELLEACDWLGELHLLDDQSGAGKRARFGNRQLVVRQIEAFDFSSVRIALFTGKQQTARVYAPLAAAAGCIAIDITGAFSGDSAVPLIVPEVNPGSLAGLDGGAIVAGATGAVVPLARVLYPLHTSYPIGRVHATICVPVSESGVAGVTELATQTAELLGGRPSKAKLFSEQVAFNIQHLSAETIDQVDPEAELTDAIARLFGASAPAFDITMMQVPVFFGFTIHLSVSGDPACDAQFTNALLAAVPGIKLHPAGRDPNAVLDAAGSSRVHLAQVRDGRAAGDLNIWVVADNVRCCRADNGVRIASLLAREHL